MTNGRKSHSFHPKKYYCNMQASPFEGVRRPNDPIRELHLIFFFLNVVLFIVCAVTTGCYISFMNLVDYLLNVFCFVLCPITWWPTKYKGAKSVDASGKQPHANVETFQPYFWNLVSPLAVLVALFRFCRSLGVMGDAAPGDSSTAIRCDTAGSFVVTF